MNDFLDCLFTPETPSAYSLEHSLGRATFTLLNNNFSEIFFLIFHTLLFNSLKSVEKRKKISKKLKQG